MKTHILLFSLSILFSSVVIGQVIPIHQTQSDIYEFMDEMASLKLIQLNSAIKPYSRSLIAEKLLEVSQQKDQLNKRQTAQLDFYLKEFEKETGTTCEQDNLYKRIREIKQPHQRRADLFFYRDSTFTMSINPIGGYKYYFNNNLNYYHQWSGTEASATIGKNWAFYVSFRDNETSSTKMKTSYLSPDAGQDNKSGPYFSDMRGGAFYSWKWGHVGFLKDHFIWGSNNHGSIIFSGRALSFPYLKLGISPAKWFEFNYIHGWMISEVVDSNRIFDFGGGAIRKEFYSKYLAANMYSFHLWKYLTASIGNSMVYSNTNVQPAYLIPFILFKSVEHTIAASNENNAQIFMDFSSRNIKHLHLYGTFYVDEVNFSNMFDTALHSNWFGYKAGFSLSDFPVQNLVLRAEYTRTNPMIYKHYYPTSSFESNKYNLGHFLRDNAQEYFISLDYFPLKSLRMKLFYFYEEKGPDYPDDRSSSANILGKKFMTDVEWKNSTLGFRINYELFHDAFISAEIISSNITAKDQPTLDKYTYPQFQGKTLTYSLGLNFGF